VPASVVSALGATLLAGEDEIAQHYAVRAIANIAACDDADADPPNDTSRAAAAAAASAMSVSVGSRLATVENVNALLALAVVARSGTLRDASASAAARLLRRSRSLRVRVAGEKGRLKQLLVALRDAHAAAISARAAPNAAGNTMVPVAVGTEPQQLLLVLVALMSERSSRSRLLRGASTAEERGVARTACRALEAPSPLLRAKGALLLAELCASDVPVRVLSAALEAKALPLLERALRTQTAQPGATRDGYMQAVSVHVLAALQAAGVQLMRAIEHTLSQGRSNSKNNNSNNSNSNSSNNNSGGGGGEDVVLNAGAALCRLLQSPLLQPLGCAPELSTGLAQWLGRTRSPLTIAPNTLAVAAPTDADVDQGLIELTRALISSPAGYASLRDHASAVRPDGLVAALVRLVGAETSADSLAFEAVKLALQLLLVHAAQHDAELDETRAAKATGGSRRESDAYGQSDDLVEESEFTRELERLISEKLVPSLPRVFERAEPLPLYALTLVGTASELCPAVADAAHAHGLGAKVPGLLLAYARDGSVQPATLILLLRLLESPRANRGEMWDAGLAPLLVQLLLMGAATDHLNHNLNHLGAAQGFDGTDGAGGGSALAHASLDVTLDSLHTLLAFIAEPPADTLPEAAAGVLAFWAARSVALLPAAAPLIALCHHADPALATKAARCALLVARMCGEGGHAAAPTEARAAFVEGASGAALRDALERDEPERATVAHTLLALLRVVLPTAAQ